MSSIRRWLAAIVLFGAAGCESGAPAAAGVDYCAVDSAPDRWRPGQHRILDSPLSDSGATPVAGIVSAGDTIMAFDRNAGSVLVVAPDGTVRRRIGRPGQGPGEFAPYGTSTRLSLTRLSRDWLLRRGDTLVVFDGNQFHHYGLDGGYRTSVAVADTILGRASQFPRETSRLVVRDDRLWLDVAQLDYAPGAPSASALRTYSIWSLSSSDRTRAITVRLPTPPISPRGAVDLSTREARPMFALAGSCVVISDGGSPHLLVFGPGAAQADTLHIRATLLDPPASDAERAVRQASGAGSAPAPEPTLPARLRRLAVDPDGRIWLLPVQRDTQRTPVEVIRLHIATGAERRDSITFFPSLFLPDGGFAAMQLDSLGLPRLRRALPIAPPKVAVPAG